MRRQPPSASPSRPKPQQVRNEYDKGKCNERHDRSARHGAIRRRPAAGRLRPRADHSRHDRRTRTSWCRCATASNLSSTSIGPTPAENFPRCWPLRSTTRTFRDPTWPTALPPQPAWSSLWAGPLEAGDTKFFVSRGYVHVIGSPRGVGKSEGGGSRAMGQLRSDRMDRAAALVRRQCRHGRHFRLRRRAACRRQETAAASESDLPVRSARRLWRAGRLPRRISRRRHSSVPLSASMHFSAMHQHKGPPGALPPEQGSAVAGGDEQSRLQDVSARLQCDRAEGPAHAALFQCAGRSVRQRSGGEEKPKPSSRRSKCRPIPARAGTATPTRPISTAASIDTAISRRRKS